jgi:hypothetical protein
MKKQNKKWKEIILFKEEFKFNKAKIKIQIKVNKIQEAIVLRQHLR